MEGPDLAMLPELDLGPAQCGGSGGRRGRLAGQGGYLALQLGEDQILVEGGSILSSCLALARSHTDMEPAAATATRPSASSPTTSAGPSTGMGHRGGELVASQ